MAEIVQPKFKRARRQSDTRRADANRRIGRGGSRWDFLRRLAGRYVALGREQITDREAVHDGKHRSVCRWARAGRLRGAPSCGCPVFSSGADHRAAAGAAIRHAEGCAKAAAGQAEGAGRRASRGEASRALSRPDIRARLGRRQTQRIHRHRAGRASGSAARIECRRCSTIHSSPAEFRALNARRRCGRTLRRNCRPLGRCARPSLG